MKKFIFWFTAVLAVFFIGFFGIRACVNDVNSTREANRIKRAEREAAITPLTEKEAELWAEVYAAAVRRGVWYPEERANSAIIELRKMTGGAE